MCSAACPSCSLAQAGDTLLYIISFMLLVVTGLPVFLHDSAWMRSVIDLEGGFRLRSLLHRAGAIGLAIVMLKPQIGLVVVAASAFTGWGRRVILAAGVISFLLAVPAFLITPVFPMLADYMGGVSQYISLPVNQPQWTTGLRHAVWAAGGEDVGMLIYLSLALIFVAVTAAWGVLRAKQLMAVDYIMAAIAAVLFFATFHGNDFVLAGVLLLYCAALSPFPAALAVSAMLLIWRATTPMPVAIRVMCFLWEWMAGN